MPAGQVLEFTDVTKRFNTVTAVSELSVRVEPGAVTGMLGPNGAGKTTSLRILLGQIKPTSGTATIGGVPYSELRQPLRTVGAVLEESIYRPRRTATRQLMLAAKSNGIPLERVGEVLHLVGLQDDADTRLGSYSLGMRQRLAVANALLGDPGVLVLDEPANGLDPEGIRWMRLLMRRLADEGRTVLVSSHVLSEIEQVADNVVVLSRGRAVYSGSMDELADPTGGAVVVDADDRIALAAALTSAGLSFDVLRSGVTVRGSDATHVGAVAAAAGIALSTLQQRGPSLEEVFLDLIYGRRSDSPRLEAAANPVAHAGDARDAGPLADAELVAGGVPLAGAAAVVADGGAVAAAGVGYGTAPIDIVPSSDAADETPAEEIPAEEAPAEETPADGVPADAVPADGEAGDVAVSDAVATDAHTLEASEWDGTASDVEAPAAFESAPIDTADAGTSSTAEQGDAADAAESSFTESDIADSDFADSVPADEATAAAGSSFTGIAPEWSRRDPAGSETTDADSDESDFGGPVTAETGTVSADADEHGTDGSGTDDPEAEPSPADAQHSDAQATDAQPSDAQAADAQPADAQAEGDSADAETTDAWAPRAADATASDASEEQTAPVEQTDPTDQVDSDERTDQADQDEQTEQTAHPVVLPFATEAVTLPPATDAPTFNDLITGIPSDAEESVTTTEAIALPAHPVEHDDDDDSAVDDAGDDPRLAAMRTSLSSAASRFFDGPAPDYPYGNPNAEDAAGESADEDSAHVSPEDALADSTAPAESTDSAESTEPEQGEDDRRED